MSKSARITTKDLGKFERKFAEDLRANIQIALGDAGPECTKRMRVESASVMDLGGYRVGWRYTAAPMQLKIYNAAPHAIFVEKGRKPFSKMPPLAPILAWVLRHGMDKSLAWPLCRAIAKRGIKGRPILEQSTDILLAIIRGHLAKIVMSDMHIATKVSAR